MREGGFSWISWIPVNPLIWSESNGITNGKVEAGIPVDDDENIKDNSSDSEGIWKVSPWLGLLEKVIETVEPEETIESPYHWTRNLLTRRWECKIGNVRGEKTQEVKFKMGSTEVVLAKFLQVLYHHPFLQVTLMESNVPINLGLKQMM